MLKLIVRKNMEKKIIRIVGLDVLLDVIAVGIGLFIVDEIRQRIIKNRKEKRGI